MNIFHTLKCQTQYQLRKLGLEIRRYELSQNQQIVKFLHDRNVDLLLDIGANTGQYASNMRLAGYKKRILSFEPLSDAHARLIKFSSEDKLWDIAPRCAIGSENSQININVAKNSVSSSILPILDAHIESAPSSKYINQEITVLRTIDSFQEEFKNLNLFIKIDTQGYEEHVIAGGYNTLQQACGLQLEVSLAPLYENQPIFINLITKLEAFGFKLWDVYPEFRDPKSGQLLQLEAVFMKQ